MREGGKKTGSANKGKGKSDDNKFGKGGKRK
jgi:hypothetical protein